MHGFREMRGNYAEWCGFKKKKKGVFTTTSSIKQAMWVYIFTKTMVFQSTMGAPMHFRVFRTPVSVSCLE